MFEIIIWFKMIRTFVVSATLYIIAEQAAPWLVSAISQLVLLCSKVHNRKNRQVIDTIDGATSSKFIYNIDETARANNPKPYDYFEHLLSELQSTRMTITEVY